MNSTISSNQWLVLGLLLILGLLEAIVHPSVKNFIVNFTSKVSAK